MKARVQIIVSVLDMSSCQDGKYDQLGMSLSRLQSSQKNETDIGRAREDHIFSSTCRIVCREITRTSLLGLRAGWLLEVSYLICLLVFVQT